MGYMSQTRPGYSAEISTSWIVLGRRRQGTVQQTQTHQVTMYSLQISSLFHLTLIKAEPESSSYQEPDLGGIEQTGISSRVEKRYLHRTNAHCSAPVNGRVPVNLIVSAVSCPANRQLPRTTIDPISLFN